MPDDLHEPPADIGRDRFQGSHITVAGSDPHARQDQTGRKRTSSEAGQLQDERPGRGKRTQATPAAEASATTPFQVDIEAPRVIRGEPSFVSQPERISTQYGLALDPDADRTSQETTRTDVGGTTIGSRAHTRQREPGKFRRNGASCSKSRYDRADQPSQIRVLFVP